MLRWHNAFLGAVVLATTACGDGGEAAPSQGIVSGIDSGALDAGPAVQVILPPPADAGPQDAGAKQTSSVLDAGAAVSDTVAFTQIDASMAAAAVVSLGAANACGAGPEPFAQAVKLRELSLYQAVKIPLYKDGAWVTNRNAMVVQGKKGLVRAFVDPQSGFTPHTLRGALVLSNAGNNTVLTSERMVSRASSDDVADSTFDFVVDGTLIGPDTKISVSVLETTCSGASSLAGSARLPAAGTQPLNPDSTGTLHVVIVPVTLSGRSPDTSEAQISKAREALRAYYPVADVQVSVRAPITYGGTVQASGTGWAELLMQITRQRTQDAVANNVYYFGWIAPAASFKDYCRSGCVLGLAPQTTTISRPNQVGLGVGFVDDNTYTTIVHELGHAHGLPHAPCVPRGGTIDGADTKFPYTNAKIGVWGWDQRSSKLMAPDANYDVMSYCEPVWISDYNYQKLATRSKAVNNAAYVYTPADKSAPQRWHGVIVHADGTARWAGLTTEEQPGELSDARALDAQGDELAELSVVRVPLSNDQDSFLYVPDLASDWTSLDLGDRTIEIAAIAPAVD